MDLVNAISQMGLSEKESKLYLTLLEHGQKTGYELARFLGLKPTATYYTLEELRKKGLVHKIPYPKKQIFAANDPRDVVSGMHTKLQTVESVLPQLMALADISGRANVKFYDGIEGFKKALNDFVAFAAKKELVGFYMYKPTMSQEQIDINVEHRKNLAKAGVTMRGLTPDSPVTKKYAQIHKEQWGFDIRTLPADLYPLESSIETAGSATLILSRDLGQNFLIDNQEIAGAVRHIFDLVWHSAEFITSPQFPGKKK